MVWTRKHRASCYILSILLALAAGGAWAFFWRSDKSLPEFHDLSECGEPADTAGYLGTSQPYFWKFALNSITDYFYAKDLEGRYLGQNKAMLNLYHHPSEASVIGKTNYELYPYMDKAALNKLEEADLRASYSPVALIAEEYVPSESGELMVCESVKCSYRAPDGSILGMICVSRDITSRKQMETALLESRAEAQAANRAKSAFLANTSHEIRTPLNGITGMLYLVMQTDLTEEQRGYLQKANESAKHLLGVVNDILDFSKIEAGKMVLECIPFSLRDVVGQVVELHSLPAQQAGVDVAFICDPKIPRRVMGDSMRVKQVLTNLVGNAVKFTLEGSISIVCSLLEHKDEIVRVQVAVSDTGVGIEEKQLAGLFKAFSQGDASRTRQYGGTGLGLAISRDLVPLMGGEITVSSRVGEGSTFSFTVPLGIAADSAEDDVPLREYPPLGLDRLAGHHVLLVEDNTINRLIAFSILEKYGMIVDEAQYGVEALEKIRQNSYELVLMDIQMPLMDGLTATRTLRMDPRYNSLPIIAMTAHAMKSDYEESLSAGMQEHVTKPIDPQALCEVLLRWLK